MVLAAGLLTDNTSGWLAPGLPASGASLTCASQRRGTQTAMAPTALHPAIASTRHRLLGCGPGAARTAWVTPPPPAAITTGGHALSGRADQHGPCKPWQQWHYYFSSFCRQLPGWYLLCTCGHAHILNDDTAFTLGWGRHAARAATLPRCAPGLNVHSPFLPAASFNTLHAVAITGGVFES